MAEMEGKVTSQTGDGGGSRNHDSVLTAADTAVTNGNESGAIPDRSVPADDKVSPDQSTEEVGVVPDQSTSGGGAADQSGEGTAGERKGVAADQSGEGLGTDNDEGLGVAADQSGEGLGTDNDEGLGVAADQSGEGLDRDNNEGVGVAADQSGQNDGLEANNRMGVAADQSGAEVGGASEHNGESPDQSTNQDGAPDREGAVPEVGGVSDQTANGHHNPDQSNSDITEDRHGNDDDESEEYATPGEESDYSATEEEGVVSHRRRRDSYSEEEEEEEGEEEKEEEREEEEEEGDDEKVVVVEEEGDDEKVVVVEEEEVNSPMFVPRAGKFFQHDNRYGDDKTPEVEPEVLPLSRADQADRWDHSMYKEDQQGPRQEWEKKRDVKFWEERDRNRVEGRGGDDRGRRNRNRDLGSYMNEGQSRGGRDRRGGEQRSYRRNDGGGFDDRGRGGGERRRREEEGGRQGNEGRRSEERDYNRSGGGGEERRRGGGREGGRRRDDGGRRERYGREDSGGGDERRGGGREWDEGRGRRGGGGGRWDEGRGRRENDKENLKSKETWPSLPGTMSHPSGENPASSSSSSSVQWGPKKVDKSKTGDDKSKNTKSPPTNSQKNELTTLGVRNSLPSSTDLTPKDSTPQDSPPKNLTPRDSTPKDPSPRTMFGSGSNSSITASKSTTVFSLSREKELVKSHDRKGKARGRGQYIRNKPPPPKVGGASNKEGASDGGPRSKYPPPKPGSGGIMVVENEKPKDKETSTAGQFDHAPDHPRTTVDENGDGGGDSEVYDQPGFPLRRRVDVGVASESSPAATDEGEEKSRSAPYQGGGASGGGGGSVQTAAASKPKRYSSQRQKLGATSGHSEDSEGSNLQHANSAYSSDQAYQETIAQQMKLLQMQQDSLAAAAAMGGGAGGNVAGMYQNPIFLQQLMWMTMQQQREQASALHGVPLASNPNSSGTPSVPEGVIPPAHFVPSHPGEQISVMGYPPNMVPQLPMQGGPVMQRMDQVPPEVSPHHYAPHGGGLYYPPFPPKQVLHPQTQHHQQPSPPPPPPSTSQVQGAHVQTIGGKQRSQAIPIISPKE